MNERTIKLDGKEYRLIPIVKETTKQENKKKPNRTSKSSSIKVPKGYSGVVRALADSYRLTTKDYIERSIMRKLEGNNPMAIIPIPEKHNNENQETFSFWLHPSIQERLKEYLETTTYYTYTTFIQAAIFGWDCVDCIADLSYI